MAARPAVLDCSSFSRRTDGRLALAARPPLYGANGSRRRARFRSRPHGNHRLAGTGIAGRFGCAGLLTHTAGAALRTGQGAAFERDPAGTSARRRAARPLSLRGDGCRSRAQNPCTPLLQRCRTGCRLLVPGGVPPGVLRSPLARRPDGASPGQARGGRRFLLGPAREARKPRCAAAPPLTLRPCRCPPRVPRASPVAAHRPPPLSGEVCRVLGR